MRKAKNQFSKKTHLKSMKKKMIMHPSSRKVYTNRLRSVTLLVRLHEHLYVTAMIFIDKNNIMF